MTDVLHPSTWSHIGTAHGFSSIGKYNNPTQKERIQNLTVTNEAEVVKDSCTSWKQLKPLDRSHYNHNGHYRDNVYDIKVTKQNVFKPSKSAEAEVTSPSTVSEPNASPQEYKEQKTRLTHIAKSHNGFLKALEKKAIEFMLYKEQSVSMIDLTAAYLYVKLGSTPTATEVYKAMLEFDFQENVLLKKFIDFIKTETGALALKSSLISGSFNQETPKRQPESNTCTESSHSSPDSLIQDPTLEEVSNEVQDTGCSESISDDNIRDIYAIDGDTSNVSSITVNNTCSGRGFMLRTLVEKENAALKNRLLCRACKQRPISVVLLPCGHFVLCNVCSEPCQVCPCCQAVVLAEKKVFLG